MKEQLGGVPDSLVSGGTENYFSAGEQESFPSSLGSREPFCEGTVWLKIRFKSELGRSLPLIQNCAGYGFLDIFFSG